MPAATTHVEFAKDVYRTSDDEIRRRITNRQMFWLGSQGPDMLFFHRASVLPGSLHKYGNLMHNAKVPEFMTFFEHWVGDDPDLISYYMGFLCHYALDSTAHPLINAIAHHRYKEAGLHEGSAHVAMEGDIDVWVLHQRGRNIKSYDVNKYLKVDAKCAAKLGEMYHAMFKEVFDLDISAKDVAASVRDTGFYNGVLYPRKVTFKTISLLEKALKMPPAISGIMLVDKGDPQVINLDHIAYPLNYDETKTISDSFPELYGKAVLKAQKLLKNRSDEDFSLNFNGIPKQSA
jgi:hypothetical protein